MNLQKTLVHESIRWLYPTRVCTVHSRLIIQVNIPARMHRYRRFSPSLTANAARLAEKRGRLLLSFRGTLTRYPSPVRLALQVKRIRFEGRGIADGYSTQFQWLSLMEKCRKEPTIS